MWHRAHTALLACVVCAEQSGREGTILPFCSHHRTAASPVHSRSRSFAPFLFCHVQCGHPPVQGSARRESPIKAPFVGGFGAVCVCVCILPPPFCPLRFFILRTIPAVSCCAFCPPSSVQELFSGERFFPVLRKCLHRSKSGGKRSR